MAKVRVLLAEDEVIIALSLADLLEAEGYEVILASNGADALRKWRQLGTALDALVTDLNMPQMNGEDLIHALRGDRPDLPIVVVTGSPPPGGAEELHQQGGGCGPLALVCNPFNCAELIESLRRAVLPKHN